MSKLKIGDMAIVIHREGADYTEGCGPGTIGTIKQQCFCPTAMFEMMRGGAIVQLETAAGPLFCITIFLLRKIDPPAKGNAEDLWRILDWQPEKEMDDA